MSSHRSSQAYDSLKDLRPGHQEQAVSAQETEEPTTPRAGTRHPLPIISITSASGHITNPLQDSDSDTETETSAMSPKSSKHKSTSGGKKHQTPSSSKTKA